MRQTVAIGEEAALPNTIAPNRACPVQPPRVWANGGRMTILSRSAYPPDGRAPPRDRHRVASRPSGEGEREADLLAAERRGVLRPSLVAFGDIAENSATMMGLQMDWGEDKSAY